MTVGLAANLTAASCSTTCGGARLLLTACVLTSALKTTRRIGWLDSGLHSPSFGLTCSARTARTTGLTTWATRTARLTTGFGLTTALPALLTALRATGFGLTTALIALTALLTTGFGLPAALPALLTALRATGFGLTTALPALLTALRATGFGLTTALAALLTTLRATGFGLPTALATLLTTLRATGFGLPTALTASVTATAGCAGGTSSGWGNCAFAVTAASAAVRLAH